MTMNWLLRTRAALDECRQHVEATDSSGSEVEAFLAQYLLIVLCAEVQEEMYRVVELRATKCGDDELCSFALASSKKLLRSVKVSELSGFVGTFGPNRKDRFSNSLDERAVLQYNSAVDNRHSVAHKSGAQVTLSDMSGIIDSATRVLDSALTALIDERISEPCVEEVAPSLADEAEKQRTAL
jgi:hypothetical protein